MKIDFHLPSSRGSSRQCEAVLTNHETASIDRLGSRLVWPGSAGFPRQKASMIAHHASFRTQRVKAALLCLQPGIRSQTKREARTSTRPKFPAPPPQTGLPGSAAATEIIQDRHIFCPSGPFLTRFSSFRGALKRDLLLQFHGKQTASEPVRQELASLILLCQ